MGLLALQRGFWEAVGSVDGGYDVAASGPLTHRIPFACGAVVAERDAAYVLALAWGEAELVQRSPFFLRR